MISLFIKNSLRKMNTEARRGVPLIRILDYLNDFAPKSLSESWDNTGLLVSPQTSKSVSTVLLTNDLTEDVVQEALELQTDLIISYHPPIFSSLKKITASTWKERVIGTCIENKIAIYSPHTSWDSVPGGVNDWLASAFDVAEVTPIVAKPNSSIENAGAGRICKLKASLKISEAVCKVKSLIKLPYIKLALARQATLDSTVSSVAICAGSGGSLLSNVEADLYLTGEMSHHELLDATHNHASVVLCNHSDSERGFLKEFAKKLEKECSGDFQVHVSCKDKDPIETV